MSRKKPARQKS